MTTSRREKIEAMLIDEPGDQFLRYSLALELEKEADHDKSLDILYSLAKDETPYVPAFFMAGQQLAKLSRIEESRSILQGGIEAAQSQGNQHAAGEMTEFLAGLEGLG